MVVVPEAVDASALKRGLFRRDLDDRSQNPWIERFSIQLAMNLGNPLPELLAYVLLESIVGEGQRVF